MKRQEQIIVIFFLWLIGVFSLPNFGFAQELNVDFEEQLVLGDDPDAPMEYQFGGPRAIDTDEEGRIYVGGMNRSIRVFSPEGEHITTFGGPGRGPGEFNEITGMKVGNNGEVVVNDSPRFRATVFYNMGDSIATYSPERWKVRQGRQLPKGKILSLSDGRYVFTAKMRDPYFGRSPEDLDNRIVHIAPEDFSEFERSFFDVYEEELFDPGEPLERKMASEDYRLAKLPGDRLAVSNVVYDGIIYILDITRTDKVQRLEGAFTERQRYEILQGDFRTLKRKGIKNFTISNSGLGRFVFQRKISLVNMLASDNWIVNILSLADGTEVSLAMEIFDTVNDSYLGYAYVDDDFATEDGEIKRIHPLHLDDQNRLYYVDYSDDVPVIRVTKITVE